MTTEFLKLPSNNHAFRHSVEVERAPLAYTPPSSTEVNASRLPSQEDRAEMQLAYREQFYTDEQIASTALGHLHHVFWACLALGIAVVVVGPLVPWVVALPLVGAVSFFFALNSVMQRNANKVKLLLYLFVPTLGLGLIVVLGFVAVHRLLAVLVFGAITLFLFYRYGREPFDFYRQWLYTNPRLKPETRANPRQIPLTPNLGLLAALLAIAALVPIVSPTIAILAVTAICLVVLRSDLNPFTFIGKLKAVLGQYLTYGTKSTDAPGVWIPPDPLAHRQRTLWLLCAPLFVTLTVALCLFAPWDVLRWKVRADYGQEAVAAAFDTPFGWVFPVLQGLYDAEVAYLWVIPAALSFAVLVPYLVLAAIFRAPLSAAHGLYLEIEGEKDEKGKTTREPTVDYDKSRPEWQWYVDRIRASDQVCKNPLGEKVREADHLFLGVEPNAQFPVLMDRRILDEHCYIVGDTGAGKTSLGIAPLLTQLIRGSRDESGETSLPPPMVVIDLKGDPALFHTLRQESEQRRKELGITDPDDKRCAFRFFTPEKGKASHIFNPFRSFDSEARSEVQLCHLVLDSLGLNHGDGYGRSYYSRKSRMLLYDALTSAAKPRSIGELYETLRRFTRGEYADGDKLHGDFNYKHDSFELLATIHTLAKYEMLATAADIDNPDLAIHMPDVIEHRQIAYFWLPSALESIGVREIAKLAIFSLLTAAIDRQRAEGGKGAEPRQVFLVMDEFQRIAAENFKIILEQARSFGIGAILANQTQSDLKTHDVDLRPTIRSNTRTKMYFSVTDPEEERALSESSGYELAMLQSGESPYSAELGPDGTGQWSQSLKPRLTRNDVMAVSDHPLEFILKVSRGSGYTQLGGLPIPVRTSYPVTQAVYEARRRMPWPPLGKAMVKASESPREREAEREREVAEKTYGTLQDVVDQLEV